MRNLQKSMPVVVVVGAALALLGLAWIEYRGEGSAGGVGALRLIDAAAEAAAADAPADAYMPGLFK